MPDPLYDQDFFLWTQEQASQLRVQAGRSNVGVDWENVAEEIESLGKSDRRGVRSRLERILEHLLKLAFSPAAEPRNGWIETVVEQRRTLRGILADSPSLRREVPAYLQEMSSEVRRDTADALSRYGETEAAARILDGEGPEIERRVLDETFIPSAPAPGPGPTSTSA